ncbi:MAG: NBR1-Ig-like domain-containing protein, partial [Verrucomicrobiota bacterium]
MKPNVISRSFFVLAIMLIGAFSVTPAEAQTQLIQNSSFETLSPSMAPWYTQNSTAGWWNINNSAGAHSGNRYEYIGVGSDGVTTANNVEDVLYQDVAIPSGTTSSTLTFWLKITTADTSGIAHDTLAIEVRNTGNTVLQTLANYSNVSVNNAWAQMTLTITGYAGQTIRIAFHGKTDASIQTVFRIDDVTLQPAGSSVSVPTVATVAASYVGTSSATLNAQVTSTGGATITQERFSWGSTPSCSDGYTSSVTANGSSFSYTLTGLTPGQKYYFQAWAENSAGWGYGSALSFTTDSTTLVDNAQLTSVSVQANTQETPGAAFTQTWTMQNSGTTTWSPGASGYTLNLVGTDSLGAVPLSANTSASWFDPYATITSGTSVSPEGQATFSMNFIAPETAGTYCDTFQMCNSSGVSFGPQVTVQIIVQQAGATGQYDRAKAVSYANKYAHYVCSDGYFWTDGSDNSDLGAGTPVPTSPTIGDDCAHFVSSCIGSDQGGGGLNIPSRVPPTYGEPGAANLVNTVLIGSGYATEVSSMSSMSPGDVIAWNWSGDNNIANIDHVTLYLGNGEIAAHSASCLDVAAATWYNNTEPNWRWHLIHILDTATPTKIISLTGNLAFGSVTVGSSPQSTLTINNTGNATLTVS